MKTKKSRKLTLSAETLRNLTEPQLQQVVGEVTAVPRCNTAACTATHGCSGCQPCA